MASAATELEAAEAKGELKYGKPQLSTAPLQVPSKILMGPGPSTINPRVLAVSTLPLLGHMHPEFFTIMDECQAWLRYAFQTQNKLTLAVSGTGHAAMEAGVANIVEPGDIVVVGINGIWGERVAEMVTRFGGDARKMTAAAGTTFSIEQARHIIEEALDKNAGAKVLFLVHGESSTGTYQSLDGVGAACAKRNVLLFLDTVCTLGGVPVKCDEWGIDPCAGASPITFSDKARAKMAARKTPIISYYLDMNLVGEYWGVDGGPRKYHHTGMVTNIYQLREGLAILAEEGLHKAWERHRTLAEQLWEGLEILGLKLLVRPEERLPTVTTVVVPEGVSWSDVNAYLMKKYGLEIAGGLGPTAGKVWRIGLMGFNATPRNVLLMLNALKDALEACGFKKLK
eukprot:jgi/Chlat1/3672/Chrsp24S03848